ncbi:MAG: LysR substrate-binding domain-containing protein, partial [Alphaproteobacteria bacterium]
AVAHLRPRPARFESMVLLRDPFVLVARRGHPLLATPLSIEDYAALDHLLVSPRGQTSGAIDRMLMDFGLSRRISLLVATYLAVPAALAASDLVATVPRQIARHIVASADIDIMPLPVDFTATVSIAWHRRTASDPALSWFRSLLIGAAATREQAA